MVEDENHPAACRCALCAVALTVPLRDLALLWPDCVFTLAAGERSSRVWQSADQNPDFVVLDATRPFVRGMLPVPLPDGTDTGSGWKSRLTSSSSSSGPGMTRRRISRCASRRPSPTRSSPGASKYWVAGSRRCHAWPLSGRPS